MTDSQRRFVEQSYLLIKDYIEDNVESKIGIPIFVKGLCLIEVRDMEEKHHSIFIAEFCERLEVTRASLIAAKCILGEEEWQKQLDYSFREIKKH
jgi:hypothetical protein